MFHRFGYHPQNCATASCPVIRVLPSEQAYSKIGIFPLEKYSLTMATLCSIDSLGTRGIFKHSGNVYPLIFLNTSTF